MFYVVFAGLEFRLESLKFWTVSFFWRLATWNDSQCRPHANEFKLCAAADSHKEIMILYRFIIQSCLPSTLHHKVLNWTPQAAIWTFGNQGYRRNGENLQYTETAIYHQLVICSLLPDVDSGCYKTVRPLACGFGWKCRLRTYIPCRPSHSTAHKTVERTGQLRSSQGREPRAEKE